MTKRKKTNQRGTPSAPPEEGEVTRVRLKGELLELTPTAEYPIQVLETQTYETWINGVSDPVTRARITNSVDKMRRGLFGDWKEVGAGVFEMRMDFGPGYRAYYAKQGRVIVVLLGGGEKSSQQKDIAEAQRLWGTLRDEITEV